MFEQIALLVIGAFLGICVDHYRQYRKVEYFHNAMLEELDDIKQQLIWIRRSYEESIKVYALGGFDHSLPLMLSNPIFSKHYSDVAIKLRSSQRKSFSLINSYIEGVNDQIENLKMNHPIFGSKNTDNPISIDTWGSMLKAGYISAAITEWHVNYHLRHSEFPFLDEDAETYSQYLSDIKSFEQHVDYLISSARKNLKREDFE